MKIAWFTPFYQNSAIGKYSQAIMKELPSYCSVDLWVPSGEGTLLDTDLKVIRFTPDVSQISRLTDYDCIIYNLGDHLDFHQYIYDIAIRFKGVVILHDFVMHHFFAAYYFTYLKDKNAYLHEMSRLYGEDGQKAAADSQSGLTRPVWETDEIVIKYPFFEKAIEGALGVIVHSHFLADKVKQSFLGPVAAIPYPFHKYPLSAGRGKTEILFEHSRDNILLLTVGNVNANKRIDKIIKAIGKNSDISENIKYIIIGHYDSNGRYFASLQALVTEYGLQDKVSFLGYQPDEILFSHLSSADICLNLRFPAMEGASWSLIEQLYFGKPVVVIDSGYYSEFPDNCVLKINPQNEDEELANMLKKLISDKKFREETGSMGEGFARQHFSAPKYCQELLKFYEEVRSYKPLLALTDKVGQELSMMAAIRNIEPIPRIAGEIYNIFKTSRGDST